MSLFDDQTDDVLKGAFHGATLTLLGLMALYHWVRWWRTGRGRNLGSAILYTSVAAIEPLQIRKHL